MDDDKLFSGTTQRALNWGAWAVVVVSLLASLLVPPVAYAQGREWHQAVLQTPDGELRFAKSGSGPLLLVLPGANGALHPEAYRDFTAGWTVVVLNLPYEARPIDVERVRQHFAVQRIALYGQARGAQSVQRYAAAYPQRVQRVVYG